MTWSVRNILTFGADGRLRQSREEYARLIVQLVETEALVHDKRSEAARALDRLLERKRDAVEIVRCVASLENVPEENRRAFANLETPPEDEASSVTVERPMPADDLGVHLAESFGAALPMAAGLLTALDGL